MTRFFAVLAGLWIGLHAVTIFAQSPGPTITQDGLILLSNATATGNGTPINVGGFGIVTYQVTALSGTATIVPESSIDGTNYNTLTCYALDGTTSVTSFSGTGTWRCNVTGQNWARSRISSCTGCTVSVQATKWVSGQVSKAPTHIPVTVPEGGTGDTTLTSGAYLKGAGTSPITTQSVPIPCTDGGTGLTSGTSGGVLAYTATCTLASSTALTQNAMVIGGGAGAPPSTTASALTNGQVYIGVTSAAPQAASLSAGSGISITPGSGSITIASTVTSTVPRGYIDSLTMSTAGGSGTMTIAAGSATDSTNANIITLSSPISKTTSAFSAGTGNGCLDTGSISTSSNYYFYLIENTTSSAVDVACSTQNVITTGPTMPAGFTLFRYIGSGRTDGSSHWLGFTQVGDYFIRKAAIADVNTTNPGTNLVTSTITVPSVSPGGVTAIIYAALSDSTPSALAMWVHDLSITDTAATGFLSNVHNTADSSTFTYELHIQASTASQIGYRLNGSTGNTIVNIDSIGYIDRRGKDN